MGEFDLTEIEVGRRAACIMQWCTGCQMRYPITPEESLLCAIFHDRPFRYSR